MNHWPEIALGDVFEIARGGSPRPIDAFITEEEDGVNWISISDASESSKYIERTKRRIRPEGVSRSRTVVPGDFLLTNSMSFGRPYIMGTTGCIHDGWLVLGKKREDVDRNFFYRLLGSKTVYAAFEKLAAGATVKNLNIDLVKGVKVPFPLLPEQRRIAAVLDEAHLLGVQRRRALAELDRLAQAMFIQMFGSLTKNEMNWPIALVADFVSTFESGKSLSGDDEESDEAKFRVLKVSAVTSLEFRPDQSKALPVGYVPPPTHLVKAGDLLFSRANTAELIGATALVRSAVTNLALPDKLWRFVWHDPPRASPEFVHYLFRQEDVRGEISQRASGSSGSMKNISQPKVLSIAVGLPPLELQRVFAARLRAIESLKAIHRAAVAECDTLFASLEHRAFTGAL